MKLQEQELVIIDIIIIMMKKQEIVQYQKVGQLEYIMEMMKLKIYMNQDG